MKSIGKTLALFAVAVVAMVSCTEKPEIVPNDTIWQDTIPNDTISQDTIQPPVDYSGYRFTLGLVYVDPSCPKGDEAYMFLRRPQSSYDFYFNARVFYTDSTMAFYDFCRDAEPNFDPENPPIFYRLIYDLFFDGKMTYYDCHPGKMLRYELRQDTLILNPGPMEMLLIWKKIL